MHAKVLWLRDIPEHPKEVKKQYVYTGLSGTKTRSEKGT
jgi:hypothetical protein